MDDDLSEDQKEALLNSASKVADDVFKIIEETQGFGFPERVEVRQPKLKEVLEEFEYTKKHILQTD